MQRITLDTATPEIKDFVLSLPDDPEGVELVLNGQVLRKVILPLQLSDVEKRRLIETRRALIRQARERTKDVPAKVLQREIRKAVNEVRRRKAT